MQKSKAKRGLHWLNHNRDHWLTFIALWTLSQIAATALLNTVMASQLPLSENQSNTLSFLLFAAPWLIQVELVQRLLKHSMRGWLVYTVVSTLIAAFISSLLRRGPHISAEQISLLMSVLHFTPVLVQTRWLWPRVHHAWLWAILGALIAYSTRVVREFSAFNGPTPYLSLLEFFATLMTGSLMYFLWSHPKDAEKTKIGLALDAEEKRLARLQEQENHNPLWDDDHPTLQRDAQ